MTVAAIDRVKTRRPGVLGEAPHTRPASLVTHPVAVFSLAVLIVNDHVLKDRFHNQLTGKLSDFAGLVFFPMLLVGLIEVGAWLLRWEAPDRTRVAMAAGVLTALLFAGVQTVDPVTELYRQWGGLPWGRPLQVVADPTDLMALPAVLVAWAVSRPSRRKRPALAM